MPDSESSRIARLEQRADDVDHDIRAFAPLVASQAVMEEQMKRLREDFAELRTMIAGIDKTMQDRLQARDDSSLKRFVAIIGAAAVIIAAVITAVATILANVT